MKVIITFTFCCDDLCKSKLMALEKPGKLREFFLLLCGHPVNAYCLACTSLHAVVLHYMLPLQSRVDVVNVDRPLIYHYWLDILTAKLYLSSILLFILWNKILCISYNWLTQAGVEDDFQNSCMCVCECINIFAVWVCYDRKTSRCVIGTIYYKWFHWCASLMLVCEIVRGAFGEVRLAFIKSSCEKVAVKVIEKKSFTATTTTDAVSFSSFFESACTRLHSNARWYSFSISRILRKHSSVLTNTCNDAEIIAAVS